MSDRFSPAQDRRHAKGPQPAMAVGTAQPIRGERPRQGGARLQVALVTSYPATQGRVAGGIQAVSVRLVEHLRRIPGLEIHVVHCHSDVAESRVVRIEPEGASPVTLHFLGQTRRRIVPNMVTAVDRVAGRLAEIAPDAVHAHGHNAAVAALRAGYQPIWTIHGIVAREAANYRGLFHRLRFALAGYYERQALARVQVITAVSPYVLEAYAGRSRADWRVVENPAPEGHFTLERRPVTGRVLVPADVIPLKDPLTLVRATALALPDLPDRRLQIHLAGSLADADYVAQVRAEIAAHGLGGCVSLLGPLDSERLAQAYSAAAVVALPSRQEVAPMAIVEAMAAGVPVVASAVGGIPYLVQEGVTGRLTPPAHPEALAQVLRETLSSPEAAEAMGRRGRTVAQGRFEPNLIAYQYLAIYREVADPLHGRASR